MPNEIADLIYLDPPFKSDANYNVLFKSPDDKKPKSQILAFEDTWHWTDAADQTYTELVEKTETAPVIEGMITALGKNDMTAYLVMMAIRLVEMHRVLKSTGSLYMHCDPTASHYLKVVCDSIFGAENFLNEMVWYYRGAGIPRNCYARRHDILLWYAKQNGKHYFNPDPARQPYADATVKRFKHYIGNVRDGRDYGMQKLNEKGKHPDDVFTDIQPIAPSARERLGFPTQKPLELLRRIIETSSKKGDLVLDPFCGCGTTIAASQELERRWIGIDITHLAIALIEKRLSDACGIRVHVNGAPNDLESAKNLAQRDKLQFQRWAVTRIRNVRPNKRETGDGGIDGIGYIRLKDRSTKVIVSVKGGKNLDPGMVRDLKGAMDGNGGDLGIFVCLTKPSRGIRKEASSHGRFATPMMNYPKIQIWTIEDHFNRIEPKLPTLADYVKAPRSHIATNQAQTTLPIPPNIIS